MSRWNTAGSAAGAATLAMILSMAAHGAVSFKHKSLKEIGTGVRAEIRAQVSGDGEAVRDVRAYFKTQPEERFYFAPLQSAGGDRYVGVLPAMGVGTESFDYFILARTDADEIVKTEVFTVRVEEDDAALARMERKPPRDIKIDTEPLEDARDMVEESRRVNEAERANEATEGGEPDPNRRVEVRTDTPQTPVQIAGIDDYLNLRFVPAADAIAASALAEAPTVAASAGGMSAAAIGAVAIGGAAALGGGGSSSSSSSGSGVSVGTGTTGQVIVRDDGPAADDSFQIIVDGTPVGSPTPLGGSSSTALTGLSRGQHSLIIRFAGGTPVGTFEIRLGQGVTFAGGGTVRSGVLNNIGDTAAFTIVVP